MRSATPSASPPADELNDNLFTTLRRAHLPECSHGLMALQAAPAAFVQQEQIFLAAAAAARGGGAKSADLERLGQAVCKEVKQRRRQQPPFQRVGAVCPLVARKFLDGTERVSCSEQPTGPAKAPALLPVPFVV